MNGPTAAEERKRAILEAQRLVRECLGHFVTIARLMVTAYPDEGWRRVDTASLAALALGNKMWDLYIDEFVSADYDNSAQSS